MPDSAGAVTYSVDTNVFMDWQARFYPTDVFQSFIHRVDGLIDDGRFKAPAIVEEELKAIGTTELADWCAVRRGIFVPLPEILVESLTIQNRFPGLRDPKAEFEEADAYVVALAKLNGYTVVTQETSASDKRHPRRSHYIPDVCRELGISCISLIGLMRREKWTL